MESERSVQGKEKCGKVCPVLQLLGSERPRAPLCAAQPQHSAFAKTLVWSWTPKLWQKHRAAVDAASPAPHCASVSSGFAQTLTVQAKAFRSNFVHLGLNLYFLGKPLTSLQVEINQFDPAGEWEGLFFSLRPGGS